jgi:hypothetical protein
MTPSLAMRTALSPPWAQDAMLVGDGQSAKEVAVDYANNEKTQNGRAKGDGVENVT